MPGPSCIVLIIGIFLSSFCIAAAQSTIATVPSADVVSDKKVYLEFDFISQYANRHESGFQSYVPRAVVGVGHNIEVGANLVYTDGFGVNQPIEIQPGLKWQFYRNEQKGVAAAAGAMLYTPLTHRAGTDAFVMLYAVISKKVAGKFGPRLTGGGYALVGRNEGTARAAESSPPMNSRWSRGSALLWIGLAAETALGMLRRVCLLRRRNAAFCTPAIASAIRAGGITRSSPTTASPSSEA